MKRASTTLLTILFLLIVVQPSWAVSYKGSIEIDGGLKAFVKWNEKTSNFTTFLSWEVNDQDPSGRWTYNYTFASAEDPQLSHAILEASSGDNIFTKADIFSTSLNIPESTFNFFIKTDVALFTNGNGNPYLPDTIYGIKWDFEENKEITKKYDGLTFAWSLLTPRAPMWGDFYAQGGNSNGIVGYAYNTGFGIDTEAPIDNRNAKNSSGEAWVLVPNTKTTMVPEPATMLLLGFGLMGMAFLGRRRFRK